MKLLVWVGVFALSAGIATVGFLSLSSPTVPVPLAGVLEVQTPCDLHSAPCVARDPVGHSIRFSLAPATIPVMEELTVHAELQGFKQLASARVTVEGVNMYMGYQFADLQKQDASNLSGKLILPVCTLDKMQWKAHLEANTDIGKVVADFPFETVSHSKLPPFPASLK
jgi:hypothetical protein